MSGASPADPGSGRGDLLFSGEHWINYLRLPGRGEDSAMVSIYRGRFSPVGPGMPETGSAISATGTGPAFR